MPDITEYLADVRRDLRLEEQMRIDYLFAAVNYRPEECVVKRPRHLIPEIWESVKRAVGA